MINDSSSGGDVIDEGESYKDGSNMDVIDYVCFPLLIFYQILL